jgi:3-oxoacyl-(acyl-carrier-protein) synthase
MGHSNYKVLLGSGSSGTSPHVFVGDVRLLSVSIQTSTGSASNITISLSNDDGFGAEVGHWSTVTVIPATGIYAVDPGARWIRAERANIAVSAGSNATVTLNKYYE